MGDVGGIKGRRLCNVRVHGSGKFTGSTRLLCTFLSISTAASERETRVLL